MEDMTKKRPGRKQEGSRKDWRRSGFEARKEEPRAVALETTYTVERKPTKASQRESTRQRERKREIGEGYPTVTKLKDPSWPSQMVVVVVGSFAERLGMNIL